MGNSSCSQSFQAFSSIISCHKSPPEKRVLATWLKQQPSVNYSADQNPSVKKKTPTFHTPASRTLKRTLYRKKIGLIMKKNELAFKLVPMLYQFQFEVGKRDDRITKTLLTTAEEFVVCLVVASIAQLPLTQAQVLGCAKYCVIPFHFHQYKELILF